MKKIAMILLGIIIFNSCKVQQMEMSLGTDKYDEVNRMDSVIRNYLKENIDTYLIYERCLNTKNHRNIYYIVNCEENNEDFNIVRLTNGTLFSYSIVSGYFPSYRYLQENSHAINTDSVVKLYQYWSHDPYFDFEYSCNKDIMYKGYLYRNLIPETHLAIFINMIERDLLGVLEKSYSIEYSEDQKDIHNLKKVEEMFKCNFFY